MTGLTDVDKTARELFGKDFVDCGEKSQVEILQALDHQVAASRVPASSTSVCNPFSPKSFAAHPPVIPEPTTIAS